MKPTHKLHAPASGQEYLGVIIAESSYGAVWFLPLCNDGKTWMKEPLWVPFGSISPLR